MFSVFSSEYNVFNFPFPKLGSAGEREERLAELTQKFSEMMDGKVSLILMMEKKVRVGVTMFYAEPSFSSHFDANSFQGVKWGRKSSKGDSSLFRSLHGPGRKVMTLIF